MHALSATISTNTAGSPASRTKCQAMLTSDSEIDARTSIETGARVPASGPTQARASARMRNTLSGST